MVDIKYDISKFKNHYLLYDIEILENEKGFYWSLSWLIPKLNDKGKWEVSENKGHFNSFKNTYIDLREWFFSFRDSHIFVGYNNKGYDRPILMALLDNFNALSLNKWIIEEGKNWWEWVDPYFYKKLNFKDYWLAQLDFLDMSPMKDVGLKELQGYYGQEIVESSVNFKYCRIKEDHRCTKRHRDINDEDMKLNEIYNNNDVSFLVSLLNTHKPWIDTQIAVVESFNLPITDLHKKNNQKAEAILGAYKKNEVEAINREFKYKAPQIVRDLIEETKDEELIRMLETFENWELGKYTFTNDEKIKSELKKKFHMRVNINNNNIDVGLGGIHFAISKYISTGRKLLNWDIVSNYPNLKVIFKFYSRYIKDKKKVEEMIYNRVKLKESKDPIEKQMAQAMKVIINALYGLLLARESSFYDPEQGYNITITNQILLCYLIWKLRKHIKQVNINTDGFAGHLKRNQNIDEVEEIIREFEHKIGLNFELKTFDKIFQKGVNQYVMVDEEGKMYSKGDWLSKVKVDYVSGNYTDQALTKNNIPLVGKAIVAYLLEDKPIWETIKETTKAIDYQIISKKGSSYDYLVGVNFEKSEKRKKTIGKYECDYIHYDFEKIETGYLRMFATTSGYKFYKYKISEREDFSKLELRENEKKQKKLLETEGKHWKILEIKEAKVKNENGKYDFSKVKPSYIIKEEHLISYLGLKGRKGQEKVVLDTEEVYGTKIGDSPEKATLYNGNIIGKDWMEIMPNLDLKWYFAYIYEKLSFIINVEEYEKNKPWLRYEEIEIDNKKYKVNYDSYIDKKTNSKTKEVETNELIEITFEEINLNN